MRGAPFRKRDLTPKTRKMVEQRLENADLARGKPQGLCCEHDVVRCISGVIPGEGASSRCVTDEQHRRMVEDGIIAFQPLFIRAFCFLETFAGPLHIAAAEGGGQERSRERILCQARESAQLRDRILAPLRDAETVVDRDPIDGLAVLCGGSEPADVDDVLHKLSRDRTVFKASAGVPRSQETDDIFDARKVSGVLKRALLEREAVVIDCIDGTDRHALPAIPACFRPDRMGSGVCHLKDMGDSACLHTRAAMDARLLVDHDFAHQDLAHCQERSRCLIASGGRKPLRKRTNGNPLHATCPFETDTGT